MPSSGKTNFLDEYTVSGDGTVIKKAGDFETKKKEVIIDIITACLNEEINVDQNRFADLVGITYEFNFPVLSKQDWMNSIDDISILAFVQGIPIGNAEGVYYNNFALGGSKIVESRYIYITTKNGYNYYHDESCELIKKDANGEVDYTNDEIRHIVLNKNEAITEYEAYPCLLCH